MSVETKYDNLHYAGLCYQEEHIDIVFLKSIFKKINNDLYANTNSSKTLKQGSEMIRILFCKIYDEKHHDKLLEFQLRKNETAIQTKERITKNLWLKIKSDELFKGIFTQEEKLELDAESFCGVVKELQRYNFSKSSKDIIGEAFEVFTEKQFKGEKGQFFTPKAVVSMMVKMADLQKGQKILDPACGSGGFLVDAFLYITDGRDEDYKKMIAQNCIYGFDKESDLVKICNLYMILMSDGKCNIKRADTLKVRSADSDNENGLLPIKEGEEEYDIILTNPPFGDRIKIKHENVLKNFELTKYQPKKGQKFRETSPQILFLELCYKALKKNGKLGIVLPDSIFSNPTMEYVRSWILEKFTIEAIIDCPKTTFAPYTTTKTCVAFLIKKRPTKDSKVFLAIANNPGHSTRGEPIYDKDVLREDFTTIARNYLDKKDGAHLGFYVSYDKIVKENFIPRYYDPNFISYIEGFLANPLLEPMSLQELCEQGLIEISGIKRCPKGEELLEEGEYRFVKTSNINNMEIENSTKNKISEETLIKYAQSQDLKVNDILFVKDGDYKVGSVAMIWDKEILVQSHFYKIRAKKISPFIIFYMLNLHVVREQVEKGYIIQTTIRNFPKIELENLRLPFWKDKYKNEKIEQKMKEIMISKMNNSLVMEEMFNE